MPSSATKLLGQRIMVGMSGTAAPSWLLHAAKAGQVGSVILFAANIVSRQQTVALTNALQRAARAGGNPKLLIAVDQEGGQVKRIPSGAPTLSPPQMAATNNVSVASSQGRATGQLLKRYGINMDLAPVSDVPTFSGAFIWQQGRAFSFNAGQTAKFATAFALGVQSAGVAATAKHFPGLGSAPTDTDSELQELHPTAAQRGAALKPYERMIPRGLDAVLVAIAGFPASDSSGAPAALSRPIIQGLLRKQLALPRRDADRRARRADGTQPADRRPAGRDRRRRHPAVHRLGSGRARGAEGRAALGQAQRRQRGRRLSADSRPQAQARTRLTRWPLQLPAQSPPSARLSASRSRRAGSPDADAQSGEPQARNV